MQVATPIIFPDMAHSIAEVMFTPIKIVQNVLFFIPNIYSPPQSDQTAYVILIVLPSEGATVNVTEFVE